MADDSAPADEPSVPANVNDSADTPLHAAPSESAGRAESAGRTEPAGHAESVEDPESVEGSRRPAGRWIWWFLGAVAVLTTAAGATLSLTAIATIQNMPRTLVAQYLGELEHGRAQAAMHLAGIRANSSDVLLNDTAYSRITDRINSFTVHEPVTRGGKTTVPATITQGDRTYDRSFPVERAGGLPGLSFWKLGGIEPDTVDVMIEGPAGLAFTVAGEKPKSSPIGTAVTLRAMPGTYPVAVTSKSKNFDVPVSDVTTIPAGDAQSPAVFTARLSDSGQAAAQTAINTWLDACIASRDAEPAQCPFGTFPEDPGDDISDVRWQLLTRPSITIDPIWITGGGWSVDSTSGSVSAIATLTRRSDGAVGEGFTDPMAFAYAGVLTFDGSGAVFTPLISNDDSQAGA